MKNTITYLDDAAAKDLADQILSEQTDRIKQLHSLGAKSVEGITTEGKAFRSALDGED